MTARWGCYAHMADHSSTRRRANTYRSVPNIFTRLQYWVVMNDLQYVPVPVLVVWYVHGPEYIHGTCIYGREHYVGACALKFLNRHYSRDS